MHTETANHAREQARERLQDLIDHLKRSAYEMELYAKQLDAAVEDRRRAEVIDWAINHLVSYIVPNFDIDLLTASQAELAALAAQGAAK